VALAIDENSTPALATAILANAADLAFVRPLLGDSAGLTTEHLFDEEVLVALPQGHPLARFRSLSLWALASENFVLFPRLVGSGLYDEIIAACQRSGFSPRVTQEASQVTSIVNLVAAGLGVSLVPASMQQISTEGVTYRAIAGDAPSARMSMIYREGDDSPTVANMVALARERVGQGKGKKGKG
jgi:DNA-binding transcriptional LysR family regulator